jgi:hypothetical protein
MMSAHPRTGRIETHAARSAPKQGAEVCFSCPAVHPATAPWRPKMAAATISMLLAQGVVYL